MCNRPDVHGIVVWTCIPSATQVVVRIAAAPRPPGRRCRAGNGGRDRSDPHFSMPAVASAEVGMCTPSHPPRGSLRSSDPLREGQRASRFGSSRSRSAMPNSPTSASRSANGCSAAARRRSAPFRDGSLDRSDPKGSGAGVRKPTRPRTRTEPSARWVACLAPSGLCATVGRAVDPEDSAAPADKQRVWCASPGSRSAHRHPVSNARSSTVVSGSAEGTGEPCVVPPSERAEIRLGDEAAVSLYAVRHAPVSDRPQRRRTCGCSAATSGRPPCSPCIGWRAMPERPRTLPPGPFFGWNRSIGGKHGPWCRLSDDRRSPRGTGRPETGRRMSAPPTPSSDGSASSPSPSVRLATKRPSRLPGTARPTPSRAARGQGFAGRRGAG